MFETSAKKGLCKRVIRGSEIKTSDLAAAHFSRNSGAANTALFTIHETFNEHSKMTKLSQPYLRGHMR